MKKILLFLFITALAILLVGCGQKKDDTPTVSATDHYGNVTVHTVIFHVVDSITDEFIIDCGAV